MVNFDQPRLFQAVSFHMPECVCLDSYRGYISMREQHVIKDSLPRNWAQMRRMIQMRNRALLTIQDWLFAREGQCFCDDCIASQAGIDRINISRAIIGGGFSRYKGRCVKCSEVTRVTIARRMVWA